MTPCPKPDPRPPRTPRPLKRSTWLARGKRPKARKVTKGGRNTLPEKLAWLHECACAISGTWPVEVHHERKRGERADDRRTIPLAPHLHRDGSHSRHVLGREGFQAYHLVSLDALCAEYQRRWEERS